MRRLWAYIIIVFTVLVAVFASFPNVIRGVKTNGRYETRRQFTFQLTEREVDPDEEEPAKLNDNSAKDIASIMRSRLETYNVSSYDVSTSGQDIVTVSFAADSESKYQQIITYLSFSGSFALVNESNDIVPGSDFIRGKAYTKDYAVNEYPTVIIPVKTDSTEYETLIQHAKDNPVSSSSSSSEEEGEGETVAKIYLLFNWNKGETYDTLTEAGLLDSKTLLPIEFTPDEDETGLYYDSNKNSFFRVCGFQDSNGNGSADASEVAAAYDQAEYLVNLFSASAYDYEVKCIRGLADGTKVWLEAKVEYVVDGGTVVWNRTLTAVIAAIVIITLLLAYFYKIGAVSTLATTLASVFFAIVIMVQTGLEYNAFAIVAIIVVALLSIISNIIYLTKLKEDCYKGHTIKKANAEASKKSLLPIVDVHIVTLVIGVMTYVLGGYALRTFGALLGICSVISFLINSLGMKGLMWLLTNATAVTGRYDLFAIAPENVPDHMAEEKQTFYGAYADKNISKHKKSASISAGIAFIVAIVGIIVASSLRGGELLNPQKSQSLGNEVYVQNRIRVINDESKSPLNDNTLLTILDDILVEKKAGVEIDKTQPADEKGEAETYYTFKYFVLMDKNVTFSIDDTKVEETLTNKYRDTYYILSLKEGNKLTDNTNVKIKSIAGDETITLKDAFDNYFDYTSTFTTSVSNSLSLKHISTVAPYSSPRWEKVVLATTIAILIISIYLMLRYRLSRGLASVIFPFVTSAIMIGVIVLLNLLTYVPATFIIAVPVISLMTYFFMIQFFNKDRELFLEEKVRDNSPEHRAQLSARAIGIAFAPILAMGVLSIYCFINFFGFGATDMSTPYIAMFIGTLLSLGLVAVLIAPASNFFFRLFSKVKINRKPKPSKKSKKPVHRSAEPEEAIFIGIND